MDNKPKNEYTGYYPKAGDELKFYLKHIIKLIKHGKPYENDKQFDGGTKPINRSKTRHGYDPGEDRKVYENVFHNDPVKKKRMQGKDWHSKPADTSKMSLSGNRLKNAVKAHVDEYKKNPEEYARKMSEEKIEEGYIKPYVSHSGSTATVMDSRGKIRASFNKKEHGPNYMNHANAHLKKNYDAYNTKDHRLSDLMNSPTVKHARTRHPGIQEETTRSLTDILGESVSAVLDEERAVTTAAVKAFMNHGTHKSRNTVVKQDGEHTVMTLHGNRIATHHRESGEIKGTTAGWPGPTTKGRLNGISNAAGGPGFYTKKHQLHHGDTPIDSDEWVTIRKGS